MPEGEGEATREGVGVAQVPVPQGTTTQLISETGHSTGDRIHKVRKLMYKGVFKGAHGWPGPS